MTILITLIYSMLCLLELGKLLEKSDMIGIHRIFSPANVLPFISSRHFDYRLSDYSMFSGRYPMFIDHIPIFHEVHRAKISDAFRSKPMFHQVYHRRDIRKSGFLFTRILISYTSLMGTLRYKDKLHSPMK